MPCFNKLPVLIYARFIPNRSPEKCAFFSSSPSPQPANQRSVCGLKRRSSGMSGTQIAALGRPRRVARQFAALAENCHRRNSLPPLNDKMERGPLQRAEAQKRKPFAKGKWFSFLVREAGVEPARPCEHWHLKPASLPIPPLAQAVLHCSAQELYYHPAGGLSTLFCKFFLTFLFWYHRRIFLPFGRKCFGFMI